MRNVFAAKGVLINLFSEAVNYLEKIPPTAGVDLNDEGIFNQLKAKAIGNYADEITFAKENRTCGYMVKFNEDGFCGYGAASVPMELVLEAAKLEGQNVSCTWHVEESADHKRKIPKILTLELDQN